MEKILKEERRTYTAYEAFDGTEFINERECAEYEKTAECVIKAHFKQHCTERVENPGEIFIEFPYEGAVSAYTVTDQQALDALKHYISFKGSNNIAERLDTSYIGQKVLVCETYETAWVYKLDEVISKLENLFIENE